MQGFRNVLINAAMPMLGTFDISGPQPVQYVIGFMKRN